MNRFFPFPSQTDGEAPPGTPGIFERTYKFSKLHFAIRSIPSISHQIWPPPSTGEQTNILLPKARISLVFFFRQYMYLSFQLVLAFECLLYLSANGVGVVCRAFFLFRCAHPIRLAFYRAFLFV